MNMIDVLKDELRAVEDPRVLGRTRHLLIDIVVIGVLAVICHAETWEEMEDFAVAREEWLRQFLELPGGIPSHDTLGRVFSLIEPSHLEEAFISWVKRIQADRANYDTISLDGKSLHGTTESGFGQGRKCLHVVNAYSTVQGIVLGQVKASGRGHAEINAALELVELLDIEKMVITADACIGRLSMIEKVVEKKADYVFAFKGNSRQHYDQVVSMFDEASESNLETVEVRTEGHGRKEVRRVSVIRKPQFAKGFNKDPDGSEHYRKLQCIGRVVCERELKETSPFRWENGERKITEDPTRKESYTRYFITSLDRSPQELLRHLRNHWNIENQLHWSLDVNLGEDANKTRNQIAATNLAVARKIALNIAKQDKKRRIGVKSKLKRAGWDLKYLEELLFNSHF